MTKWARAMFREKKVWVQVDSEGMPVVEGGRVPMRYSERAGAKVYRAGAGRVALAGEAPRELPEGASADEGSSSGAKSGTKSKKSKRGSGFGSAGSRTAQQAALAAEAARSLLASLTAETVVVFTDGSCRGNPGPAGSGAAVRLPDGRRGEASRSLGRATKNVGELDAVDLALDLLDEAEVAGDHPVALFTDSSYVNGVLMKGWKAKANRERILAIRARLKTRPGVRLHWVAGHVGIDGNERADQLANAGMAGTTRTRWLDAE